jgi:hypothetical protein
VPYSHEINDKPVFEKLHRTADEFREMICRQFDVLYREGAGPGASWRSRSIPISLASRIASTPSSGARLYLRALVRLEGDRRGDRAPLSRAAS